MHSLIWNSMMSFGGGWFFVSYSEIGYGLRKEYSAAWLGFIYGHDAGFG
jgi:NitT/TauT family transport system permease protein